MHVHACVCSVVQLLMVYNRSYLIAFFARHSLNVERVEVEQSTNSKAPASTNGVSVGNRTTDSVEQQSTQLVNSGSSEGGSSMASTDGASSVSVDNNNTLHNHIEDVPVVEKAEFFFTPVNRFGHADGTKSDNTGMGYTMIG